MKQPSLFDASDEAPPARPDPPDQAARSFAVDPRNHVVLEASAGTGKTRVLVDRYVRLIEEGVAPRHILAITFTRKAAAEMRERVLAELARRASQGLIAPERWRMLREAVTDIEISTIDAFCFGLLREFPLEANVDPAFDIADETETARFVNEALDVTFRVSGTLMTDEPVRLLFARVKPTALRAALASLIDRRQVALPAVARFVARSPHARSAAEIGGRFVGRLAALIESAPYRRGLLDEGPDNVPEFTRLARDLASLESLAGDPARVQQLRRRLERYFLTKNGSPRKRLGKTVPAAAFRSAEAKRHHEAAVQACAPALVDELARLDADVSHLLARGLSRLLAIAVDRYERLLEDHALLDFAGMLDRAVALMANQEEFARSRLKLQARYHHVLVDEVQDTNRRQWELIRLLIAAWGEGEGASDAPTSVFVVGDRKQSIYRFRHADVTLFEEIAAEIGALRPGRPFRHAISTSFRAVPELLAFVNALAGAIESGETIPERFTYRDVDRFPTPDVAPGARRDGQPVLGVIAQPTMAACATAVATEIASLVGHRIVRDRAGAPRPARPDDIAVLFRARAGHQYFEEALQARGISTEVYKGLGFFDAPEVQDLQALLRHLANPASDLRAAEFLRSRFVRLSDAALVRLAPRFAHALVGPAPDLVALGLGELDQQLVTLARARLVEWHELGRRLRPSELLDQVIQDTAYAFEMRGRREAQARENVKKVRALVRRVENRGYATLERIAAYFETLRAGDESAAIVDASGAVKLMTMHAAKGLEFPIVFLVNLHAPARGRASGCAVIEHGPDGEPEVAFGTTEATELEDKRDAEELRRLLYVALTRARDVLYVAAEVDDRAILRRGARSLASLLPPGLVDVFGQAATTELSEVEWATTGGYFSFRVCRPGPDVTPSVASDTAEAAQPVPTALTAVGRRRTAATRRDPDSTLEVPPERDVSVDRSGARLIGVAVHRLFQREVSPALDEDALAGEVRRVLAAEDLAETADVEGLFRRAASAYRQFRARPDVASLLEGGVCRYEVPFSFDPPDRPDERIRGVIDCLVTGADGSVSVLEFKTGTPRPEHDAQAALYREAIQAALATNSIDVHVLYL